MNRILAVVEAIEANHELHRITLDAGGERFVVITLELGDEFSLGAEVNISFKSTHVALAKGLQGEVTISNRIEAVVVRISENELLTEIELQSRAGNFTSLITTEALRRTGLREGDGVIALMKASDLYLSTV
ncbi:molybdopterin-binding protein [Prosthecochloris sp. HL-130-GSB]|jgi:molybdate transport system regulatory protein|uniref:TOBE domain-containing protein n=1 Tax=Prosthecochloris sp. HL-130-GSB TaxID=1974213 RepID=UPI000A1C17E1|nr:TOBE domain-containing protein [Prosthecochloris sp. HL-130-GSB]ARM30318.1 transporter [Prosthecochloris sp. HL-130-GSB]MBO8091939.1 TOBE domain-containing protein [Prosthecochloris sp.]